MILSGKTAIVTGASQGLGVEIAKSLLEKGANIILVARSVDLLNSVRDSLLPLCRNGQSIFPVGCDVSKTSEVDSLIEQTLNYFSNIDILINNASIFGPMGSLENVSWSAWTETINVNLLGSVYMCRMAIPHLKKSPRGKIINIAGGGAAKPYPSICAYATSKSAIIRFTEELAAEMRAYRIDVNAIAPGPLNTRFVDEAIKAGPEKLGNALYEQILLIRESGGTPFEIAANLCIYLASNTSDGVTGKLISARFDDWENLHKNIDNLNNTEIFTLRRIDPDTIERFMKCSPAKPNS